MVFKMEAGELMLLFKLFCDTCCCPDIADIISPPTTELVVVNRPAVVGARPSIISEDMTAADETAMLGVVVVTPAVEAGGMIDGMLVVDAPC